MGRKGIRPYILENMDCIKRGDMTVIDITNTTGISPATITKCLSDLNIAFEYGERNNLRSVRKHDVLRYFHDNLDDIHSGELDMLEIAKELNTTFSNVNRIYRMIKKEHSIDRSWYHGIPLDGIKRKRTQIKRK